MQMVADSLQTRIWEGQGSAVACWLVALESDSGLQTLLQFGQVKAWAEDDLEAVWICM